MFPLVVGISHATAPIDVRERFSLTRDALDAALENARGCVPECVILSTCNRFEIYSRVRREADAFLLLAELSGADHVAPSPYLYIHRELTAARHLFRVAAGADSLIPGEVQILGQVRRAWQVAHRVDTTGPVLSQLFQRAVALGKRVHSEIPIGRNPASVSSAAVQLARAAAGPDLTHQRVLIIGSGKVGEGVARCLFEHGARTTVLAHREVDRASSLARRYDARIAGWEELPDRLAESDIVISSTAAPHFVLHRSLVEEVVRRRAERPLCLIDLAVPRDVEPTVGALPGIRLYDIDDLKQIVHSTIGQRRSVLPRVEAMIDMEVARFDQWVRARSVAPAIGRLQAETDRIVQNETARALDRLSELSERDRKVVEAMASRIAGKMMHGTIQWLKATAEDDHAAGGTTCGSASPSPHVPAPPPEGVS